MKFKIFLCRKMLCIIKHHFRYQRKKVSYIFNKDNKVSNMKYGGEEVVYTYNDNALLDTVKKITR